MCHYSIYELKWKTYFNRTFITCIIYIYSNVIFVIFMFQLTYIKPLSNTLLTLWRIIRIENNLKTLNYWAEWNISFGYSEGHDCNIYVNPSPTPRRSFLKGFDRCRFCDTFVDNVLLTPLLVTVWEALHSRPQTVPLCFHWDVLRIQ